MKYKCFKWFLWLIYIFNHTCVRVPPITETNRATAIAITPKTITENIIFKCQSIFSFAFLFKWLVNIKFYYNNKDKATTFVIVGLILIENFCGVEDVYLSLPAVLNAEGVRQVQKIEFNDVEKKAFADNLANIFKSYAISCNKSML